MPAGHERHIPLRPSAVAVMAALSRGPLSGVDVLDSVESAGGSILGPGTLYRLMKELRAEGWVERVDPPEGREHGDDRRQFHVLTPGGRSVLRLEAERLRRTLAQIEDVGEAKSMG